MKYASDSKKNFEIRNVKRNIKKIMKRNILEL